MACFDGARIAGSDLAAEVYEPGAVRTTKFMQEAFELSNDIPAPEQPWARTNFIR